MDGSIAVEQLRCLTMLSPQKQVLLYPGQSRAILEYIATLERRLEIDDGEPVDGIECRDATIKLQDGRIERLLKRLADAEAARDALAAFKAYTHQRMDEAGIPTHPEGEHSAAGCRIGDRFDLLIGQRDAAKADIAQVVEAYGQHTYDAMIASAKQVIALRAEIEPGRHRSDG